MTGRDFLDPGAEVDLDSLVFEDLGDVSVGLVRERFQQRVAVVQQVDVRLGGIEVAVLARDGDLDHVAQRAGDLNAGRTPAHDDDVERAALHERRVAIDVLEQAEDARAQPGRVVQRVQRERVLGRAGGMEEVRLRAGRQRPARPRSTVSPSCVVTVRVAVSTPVISASLTSTLGRSANTPRNEWAMSLGASCEVAT